MQWRSILLGLALTADVEPAGVERIHGIVAAPDDAQRQAMNVIEQDGQTWCTHWFVMAVGVKA
jgi:hypothetical protein